MTNLLASSNHLTDDEANFVYNVEALGLPAKKAAELAGMSLKKLNAPHIIQAREQTKRELRGATQITKEDVIWGMREAIDRARLLGEPMTEIIGWEKTAKLLGYDQPQRIDINITASVDALKSQVRRLSDAELVKLVGANGVIDADFYEVDGNG
jgi:hypothetical protein